MYFAKLELIALRQLKLGGSEFWNLTIDRFFNLLANLKLELKEEEKQMKEGKSNMSTDDFDSLASFMQQAPDYKKKNIQKPNK